MITVKVDLSGCIDELIREAPRSWLEALCAELKSWPADAHAETLLHRVPSTYNADLSYTLRDALRLASGNMSWEALSCSISLCASLYHRWEAANKNEFLWAGPPPPGGMPARRIDQALYDMVGKAQREILLITFAAHKMKRLAEALTSASRRNVRIRLLLEFGVHSQNQLSHDALNAFPPDLQSKAEIFYWPLENRELNQFGKPGKLHAKAALVDDQALLSSANLTDDAFLRNLELGALFTGGDMPAKLLQHFEHLIANDTLVRWKP
jgi:phosphatidylserine/phosphatidylglycerophosphate/cardiolipin synthase-like enzyme